MWARYQDKDREQVLGIRICTVGISRVYYSSQVYKLEGIFLKKKENYIYSSGNIDKYFVFVIHSIESAKLV
jgi:hypothetical protein